MLVRQGNLMQQFHCQREDLQYWMEKDVRAYVGEYLYPEWEAVEEGFTEILQTVDPDDWTPELEQDMLYVLARDNQREELLERLIQFPRALQRLAFAGVNYPDYEARWQLAHGVGQVEASPAACETLLCHWATRDKEEYVRRRALLALSYRPYASAEPLALAAWSSGHKYQRIAALAVLERIQSPHLPRILEEAHLDPRDSVRGKAQRLMRRLVGSP